MGTFSKAKDHLNLAINQGAGTNAEAEALWEGVELSEDMGNYEEAGDYGRKLSRKFPSHELGDNGSVWSGIGAYINGDFAVAAERFDYIPTKYSDPTFTDLGRYWRGVSLIADGDTMGRVILRNVADSPVRHYYKYLSAEELSGKPLPDPAISTSGEWISYQDAIDIAWELLGEMGSPRPFLIIDNPHAKSAEILARLGLIADAESEFEKWINEVGMSETYRLAFLETAYEWGLTGMAYKLSLRLVGDFSGWMEAPVEIIRLSYPTFYEQQVRASARVQAIDPAILYAIMRRESAFRPHVVSYAGAVGLCQFMPFTGKAVSHELGEPEFSENHLYSWDVSIRFGAHYLASLLRKHQLPEYALAEYNAGPGPTERWKKVAHDNNRAVFVEAVDFFQTRHYIKNVLGDYYAYKELWDGMVFE